MIKKLLGFSRLTLSSLKDLLPIVIVIGFFQFFVLKQPFQDIFSIALGFVFVVFGLTFFVYGLNKALFPIGEILAHSLAKKGSLFWLIFFSFGLGFGTTIAEPSLTAIAEKAANVASFGGLIDENDSEKMSYAFGIRLSVAISVGLAICLGVIRILKGWSIIKLIIAGYICVLVATPFAPDFIVGVAYDSGGVTTSTITVPLVTALGVGLSSSIAGRNPMTDGFGLIALASLFPIVFVMLFGIFFL